MTPIPSEPTTDPLALPSTRADRATPADPTPPAELLSALEFMQYRLKRFVRESPDEDLARRMLFAKHWIDSAISRLRMDEELENSALLGLTEGSVSQ